MDKLRHHVLHAVHQLGLVLEFMFGGAYQGAAGILTLSSESSSKPRNSNQNQEAIT